MVRGYTVYMVRGYTVYMVREYTVNVSISNYVGKISDKTFTILGLRYVTSKLYPKDLTWKESENNLWFF